MILFGLEMWVVTPGIANILGGFQYWVVKSITGKLPCQQYERSCNYHLLEDTMITAEMEELDT